MNVNVAFGIVVVLVAEGIGYEVLRPFVLGVHGLVGDSRWVHQGTPSLRINTLGLLGDVRVDTSGVSKSRSGSSNSV